MIRFTTRVLCAALCSAAACGGAGADSRAARTTAGESTPAALAAGTTVSATIQDSISSGNNKTGDRVHAIVSRNVMTTDGRVAIPGGAAIELTIAQLHPALGPSADGVVTLDATAVTVGATTYKSDAHVGTVPHQLRGRTPAPDRDVVVTAGTPITITLAQPLKISAS